jgi:hypothetical protein
VRGIGAASECNLILIDKVLDDMYGDKWPISWATRDYYISHYATPWQAEQMRREDQRGFVASCCFIGGVVLLLVGLMVKGFV